MALNAQCAAALGLVQWCFSCMNQGMSTTGLAPEITPDELLEQTTVLAKSQRNLDIMDRTTILHGYMQLTRLDPNNDSYRKSVEDAATSLRQAVRPFCDD